MEKKVLDAIKLSMLGNGEINICDFKKVKSVSVPCYVVSFIQKAIKMNNILKCDLKICSMSVENDSYEDMFISFEDKQSKKIANITPPFHKENPNVIISFCKTDAEMLKKLFVAVK